MKHNVLFPASDPMGAAIFDYHNNGAPAGKLVVHSSMFEDDEIPVDGLFRSFAQMPPLEQAALRMAKGRILDVGAGSGCHCLALQDMGKEPVAIDISPLSVSVMADKGIDARLMNLYDDKFRLVLNGSGQPVEIDDIMLDEIDDYFDSQISDSAECSSMVADAPPKEKTPPIGGVFSCYVGWFYSAVESRTAPS